MIHNIELEPAPRGIRAAALAALVLLLACSEPAGPDRHGETELSTPTTGANAGRVVESAVHADRFVETIAVQTHLGHSGIYQTGWSSIVRPRLLELGVRHIRERMYESPSVQARMRDLASQGVTLMAGCWPQGTNYSDARHCIALATAYGAGTIDAFDGWNEVDNEGSNWPAKWTSWQKTLWDTYKGHSTWRTRPVYANSLARASSTDQIGDRSEILDYGNMHSYPAGDMPSMVSERWIPQWNKVASPKPLVVTETGYHNCLSCPTNGVSQTAQAKYLGRLVFEFFNRGIKRTSIYQLMDEGTSTNRREDNWGLVKYNGTVKPSFTTLKNIIGLLSDPGAGFNPGSLEYGLSGALGTTHATLLQKRDGRFYLALWQEVKSWDIKAKRDLNPGDDAVTLTLAKAASSIRVFHPRIGTSPVQTGRGTSIALSVPDEVILVEITP